MCARAVLSCDEGCGQGGGGNIVAATHLSRLVAAVAVITGICIQSLSTAALGHTSVNVFNII